MGPTIRIDTRELNRAIGMNVPLVKRGLAEEVNQRTLNATGRAFEALPPNGRSGASAARRRIKLYMSEPISTRIKLARYGPRKGKFVRAGSKKNQLRRVHLILQARRAKEGKPGLHGAEMRQRAGRFAARSQVGVGFMKSMFLPVLNSLNAVVTRFRFSMAKASGIARWPNSAGWGFGTPARAGERTSAVLRVGANMQSSSGEGETRSKVAAAVQEGINAEGRELARHVESKMKETLRKQGIRTA